MANEKKDAFIDLTEIFWTCSCPTILQAFGLSRKPFVDETSVYRSEGITVNVSSIGQLKDFQYKDGTATRICTKTGDVLYVQEKRDEVKKKINEALKL